MNDNFPVKFTNLEDPDYPDLLSKISSPPEIIFIKGAPANNKKAIAVVGTRKSSELGKKIAYDFSYKLAQNGCVIVSGLALGIDSAAHSGALDSNGVTWAVLAHGLDSVYPATNTKLAQRILSSGGSLISEYPEKTPPYSNQFILRNRIISGLAAAVLIIEAPEESGALATAKFALKQNRPVFVVPGSISSGLYSGSHNLIRGGARLATSAEDILDDMGWTIRKAGKKNTDIIIEDKIQRIIFDTIRADGNYLSVDKICQITKLKPREANIALTQMAFEGIIIDDGGKYRISKF